MWLFLPSYWNSLCLETDVCVWRYAPLVVHATQEEEVCRLSVCGICIVAKRCVLE